MFNLDYISKENIKQNSKRYNIRVRKRFYRTVRYRKEKK